jgi:hypothetical protein
MTNKTESFPEKICREYFLSDLTVSRIVTKYNLKTKYLIDVALQSHGKKYLLEKLGEDTIKNILVMYVGYNKKKKGVPLAKTLGLPSKTITFISKKFRHLNKDLNADLVIMYTKRCDKCDKLYKGPLESEHNCA